MAQSEDDYGHWDLPDDFGDSNTQEQKTQTTFAPNEQGGSVSTLTTPGQQMKQEMQSWLQSAASNGTTQSPANPDWFQDFEVFSKTDPEFVPVIVFFQLGNNILGRARWPEQRISQFLSETQSQAIGSGDEEVGGSDLHKMREESGSDLERGAFENRPHVQAFVNSLSGDFFRHPDVVDALNNMEARVYKNQGAKSEEIDISKVATDALYGAFSPSNRGGKYQRNPEVEFFLTPKNSKYMPDMAQMVADSVDGGKREKAQAIVSDEMAYQSITDRLQALSLYASGEPEKVAEATSIDPDVEQFDSEEVKNAMIQRALARFFETMSVVKKRDSDFSSGPSGPQTGIDESEEENISDKRDENRKEDGNIEEQARAMAQGMIEVADDIERAGKDISHFMRKSTNKKKIPVGEPDEYWSEGRPDYMEEKDEDKKRGSRIAKALRFRMYTEAIAEEIRKVARNANEGRDLIKRFIKQTENYKPEELGRPTLGENPNDLEFDDDGSEQIYNEYSGYTPGGDDFSETTGKLKRQIQNLLGHHEMRKILENKVQSLKDANLGGAAEALGEDSITKNFKSTIIQDFPSWGPFFLIPEVQAKYDTPVRRVLTDILPIKSDYTTGKGVHGRSNALLYHAIRGEMDNAPIERGWNPKSDKAWGKWTPQEAAEAIKQWRENAAKNLSMKGITRRWKNAREAASALRSMAKFSGVKTASSQSLLIQADELDAYADRLINMFFLQA
jgi:hypothetical protein